MKFAGKFINSLGAALGNQNAQVLVGYLQRIDEHEARLAKLEGPLPTDPDEPTEPDAPEEGDE